MSVIPTMKPYSAEFRQEAVRLLGTSGRSLPQLARTADLNLRFPGRTASSCVDDRPLLAGWL
jgi:transposase-like protein